MKHFLLLAQVAVALTFTPSTTPNATTNVFRNGTQIASGVTGTSYSDSTPPPGLNTYYLTATAGGVNSAPSNSMQINVPPALAPTSIALTTKILNTNMTGVQATVSSTTPGKITGKVNWIIEGSLIYSITLDGKATASVQLPTLLLRFLPVTITYVGNSTYAPSTTYIGNVTPQ